MRFANFDARGYRMVDVRSGYADWVDSYEDTVADEMDLALLDELTVDWSSAQRAVDLGCGAGRTGTWLRRKGVSAVDGVDLTPEMLAIARARGAHDRLIEADVGGTGLSSGSYDLAISCLVDEHLDNLRPLYAEARRLVRAPAAFVVVTLHPHFIMHTGMPTHFRAADGEEVAIATTVHLVSDHVAAAHAAGWRLAEMRESVIDDRWVAVKPQLERYQGHPVSAAYVWRVGQP